MIKTLTFISRIIYPKYSPFWFLTYMYYAYYKTYRRCFQYRVSTIPSEIFYQMIVTNSFCDINNAAIVNSQNIYKDDTLLQLVDTKNNVLRYVYIFPTDCSRYSVLISETMKINLLYEGTVKLQKCDTSRVSFASEVLLCLISGPTNVNSSLIDQIVQEYFQYPKLLRVNDLIEINIKHFAPSVFYNNKFEPDENVYFKCKKLFCKGIEVNDICYCAIGETTIKQTVNVQDFLPKKEIISPSVSHSQLKDNFDFIPVVPYGLQKYFEMIDRSAKPFIKRKKLKVNPVFLVQGDTGSGKRTLVKALASKYGMHFYAVENFELAANVYAQNETKLNNIFFATKMSAPCVLCINNFENFGKNNEGQYDERITSYFTTALNSLFDCNNYPLLVFCCSNEENIPVDLKRVSLETFHIDAPTNSEREQILRWVLKCYNVSIENLSLSSIANKTHGFFFEDLKTLVYYALKHCCKVNDDISEVNNEHFNKAIEFMQSTYHESLGAPKVPTVQWSDIGGLEDVKNEILKTINLPLKHPELLKHSGLKRSGILLYGPPGTGKTLIAKAVATRCNLCFLSVKGPELLNMYVGQSEQNVRNVFEKARQAAPCIIFFDELDSLAPNRGMSGDSGGVMDRVVSQLLAEMDGCNEAATIFVIGATNRPDLIDPALLRPGRFDKLLYVGPCIDYESKISVLQALARKFNLAEGTKLEDVVDICPKNITGADFYGLCSTAWSAAARRLIEKFSSQKGENLSCLTSKDVIVTFEDFKFAIENLKPSLSQADLDYFETLRCSMNSNT